MDIKHLKACCNLHCLGFSSFHPALPPCVPGTPNCSPLTSLSVLLIPRLQGGGCTVDLLVSIKVSSWYQYRYQ